jgi:hypothetical protein
MASIARWRPSNGSGSDQTIESRSGEGLYELLQRGARAAAPEGDAALGAFELWRSDAASQVSVQAQFAMQRGRRVLDTITARVKSAGLDVPAAIDVASEALEDFGSTRYTSLEGFIPNALQRSFEFTVYFGSLFPLFATNLFTLPRMAKEAASGLADLLDILGVAHRPAPNGLSLPRGQLRTRPRLSDQVRLVEMAVERGYQPALYAAALPVHQSTRVAIETYRYAAVERARVDCVLSRGLAPGRSCTVDDADDVELFLLRHFGIECSVGNWHVESAAIARRRLALHEPAPRLRKVLSRPRQYGHLTVLDGGAAH